MGLKQWVKKITGSEPDYWDFQVLSIPEWRQYVLFDGINPEGEEVEIQLGPIIRKGRGVWFLDMEPWPNGMEADAILFFIDMTFNWNKAVVSGAGKRFVAIGTPEFILLSEKGLLSGGRTTRKLIKRFKKEEGEQKVLIFELIPWNPDAKELLEWYKAAKAKLEQENFHKLPILLTKCESARSRLEAEKEQLIQEVRLWRANYITAARELMKLKAKYPELALSEAVQHLLLEYNLQRLEELEASIYPQPSIWDMVLKREKETPSTELKERVAEFKEDMKEVEEKLAEGEE